jgi:uncharacterized membrane-anchored protein
MQSRPFPRSLLALLLAIAIVNAFANHYFLYWTMRWFDAPMHFSAGVWLAGTAIWFRFFSGRFEETSKSLGLFMKWGIALAFSVGFLWEVYEAIVGLIIKGHINAMSDTFSDLTFDILGAVFLALVIWVKEKNNLKTV